MYNNNRLIITFYNGTISLTTLEEREIYSVYAGCSGNATHTIVFPRDFKDDTLLIFCDGSSFMQQYVIREDRFIWNRDVPLYGFSVREGADLYAGDSFVFI